MQERQTLGKYQIDQVLGEGGMGIVYKGYDPLIDRPVAIKTVRRSLLVGDRGKELLERFHQEAMAVGRLTHQNIIAIYDYDEGGQTGTPYFVMEYVKGREISDYLQPDTPLRFELAIDIILQVLNALGYAHAQGIIHRDIKPANIILLSNNQVKIADFGIARIMDPDLTQADNAAASLDLTQTGMVLGSPRYMSPEQCMGLPLDARSDLYSTALVLYELLTGNKAFSGKLPKAVYDRVSNPVPPAPNTSDPRVSKLFDQVLRKALAKEPANRYQDAAAFAQALRAQTQPPAVRPPGRSWLRQGIAATVFLGLVAALSLIPQIRNGSAPPPATLDAEKPANAPMPPQPSKQLSEQERQKVERLLSVAKMHLLVGRLVTPTGSNAHYAFEQVQKIDPQNPQAANGIRDISARLEQQIERLLAEGQDGKARALAYEGLKFYPNDPPLQRLAQRLGANNPP